MMFDYKAIGPEERSLEESASRPLDDATPTEGNEASVHGSESGGNSVNPEQELREAYYQTLNAMKSTYAVAEAAATSLAKTNTVEATKTRKRSWPICNWLLVLLSHTLPTLAPRPEMAQVGRKPQNIQITTDKGTV